MLGMSRKKTFVWVFMLVFVGAGFGLSIVVLLQFVNGEVGTSNTISTVQKSLAPKPITPNLLSGIDVEMQYPGIFDQVSHVKNDATALEQYNMGSNSDYRRSIAVSVRKSESNRLNEDSSYRFRMNSTDTYRESKSSIGKESVSIMTKIDRTEQTLFWLHGGKVLAVAITSTNPKDDVAAIMAVVQPSIRWRQ
jgi:hypothetical protein